MVDASVLGTDEATHGGSSPLPGTRFKSPARTTEKTASRSVGRVSPAQKQNPPVKADFTFFRFSFS